MSTDEPAEIESPTPKGGRSSKVNWLLIIGLAFVGNLAAFILAPPFDKGDPDAECAYPICFIEGTLELPAPHVVWPADHAASGDLIVWDISISSTILTMWIISVLVIVTLIAMTRKREAVPGRVQNAIEALYDGLQGFALSLGGPKAKTYVPLFVTLFIYILVSNWSGLLPFVGRIELFRAPTSDVNITIGLALVSFSLFHIEGVRALGFGGYLSKFFPVREFRNGVGAGVIAMFVGLIELMLEFVKPLTLSMRLFGNIYGGEVALGVILALTVAFVPVALYGLELMLNTVQALIFSVLTLMFILAAIEGHHEDHEEHPREPAASPVGPDELDQALAAH
ncbi:MAG: F0F1 ATP synthase subunit A [Chloroflexota bacterium]|nr:F0F1 ATP synthase subunit A [Chloroflexota bacterium]MDH5243605.1 F0F1 ATP synthase subunit A [Chloroflexota bacterium]